MYLDNLEYPIRIIGILTLEIMRLKIKATNEISWSMFLSHDLALGAILR